MDSFSCNMEGALQFWEQLDCSTSLKLAILARHGDWAEVLAAKADPGLFADHIDYGRANAACTLLRKHPSVPNGPSPSDRIKAAKDKWFQGERACFLTNEQFTRYQPEFMQRMDDSLPAEFIRRVRVKLRSWLGHPPSDDEIQRRARFGPGTTYSSLVRNPTAADKYSEKPTITRNAIWHLANLVGTAWGEQFSARYGGLRSADCVEVVRGNRFATAPKTALTDRAICIEPSVNIYFQLAMGGCIRNRLKRLGWDLNHAQTIHREMARRGSVDGSFATIDLSNASDTIGKGLVRALLYVPSFDDTYVANQRQWYQQLDDLRSTTTVFEDGHGVLLEKFSSMGNGYTFELETLLFAAISSTALQMVGGKGVLGDDLYVYGDDIIVPSEHSQSVIAALRFCGFTTNADKTFVAGPFRESCGGDFFCGHPVRGYYMKRDLNEPDVLFAFYNGTRKALLDVGCPFGDIHGWVLPKLPVSLRKIGGSERFGDTVLHGQPAIFKWRSGIRYVRTVKWEEAAVIPWYPFFTDAVRLACRLTGYGDTRGLTPRGSTSKTGGYVVWATDS